MQTGSDTDNRLVWLEKLYPGYFALTMATGIISIAFDVVELAKMSDAMAIAAFLSFCVLSLLFAWRILRFPGAVWADLTNPRLTFNFFTIVAATDICGLILNIHGFRTAAFGFWFAALFIWIVLLYSSFGVLTLFHRERNVNIVDGGWLICIVGTQSLVLLGLRMLDLAGKYEPLMMLGIFLLWGLGLILYAIFVTLFSYRIFFLEMTPEDFTPQIWVVMGAAAISANASSVLDVTSPVLNVLYEVHAVIDAIALLTWAWATWWIPLLVLIGVWKHHVKKVPLAYDPRQWSIVFPIGMYTVASYQLSLAAEFDPLHQVSHVMIWVAISVWGVLLAALLRRVIAGIKDMLAPAV